MNLITSDSILLARVGGKVAGIIANQPMFGAGAMDTDGIDKVMSFLCLCDSYNILVIAPHRTLRFSLLINGKEAKTIKNSLQ